MKVILLKNVIKLGKTGDLVEVPDGYGRNYLIKLGFAKEATSTAINTLNMQRESIAHHEGVKRQEAEALAKQIAATTLTIPVKVGANGKMFGALNTQNIAEALVKLGLFVDKKSIVLDKPIKALGLYEVTVKPYANVSAKLKIEVVE